MQPYCLLELWCAAHFGVGGAVRSASTAVRTFLTTPVTWYLAFSRIERWGSSLGCAWYSGASVQDATTSVLSCPGLGLSS